MHISQSPKGRVFFSSLLSVLFSSYFLKFLNDMNINIIFNLFHFLCLKSLPTDFDYFLWNSGFSTLLLRGPPGSVTQCSLLIRRTPRKSIKIGQGWKQFCSVNGLRERDGVVFQFQSENVNVVNVRNKFLTGSFSFSGTNNL